MATSDTDINTLETIESSASSSSSSHQSVETIESNLNNSILILDGTFFRYDPQNSTFKVAAAVCTKCTKNTTIKGFRNTTSNFISHLKRVQQCNSIKNMLIPKRKKLK